MKWKEKVSLVSVWHNNGSSVSILEKKTLKIYHVLEDINYRILRIYTGVLGENPQTSICKLTEELVASKDTTYRQIKTLGKSYGRYRSVFNELSPQQAQCGVSICRQLIGNPIDDKFIREFSYMMKNGSIIATLTPLNSGFVHVNLPKSSSKKSVGPQSNVVCLVKF